MSTIRYTVGGDYDPADSHRFRTKDLGTLNEVRLSYDGTQFVLGNQDGLVPVSKFSPLSDGIYADLSDNTGSGLLMGGTQGDVLIGGSWRDSIRGNDGDDVLVGGPGFDTVSGGKGADVYAFRSVEDFSMGQLDQIKGFSGAEGQGDRIDLSSIASFTFIGVDAFSGAGTAELRSVAGSKSYTVSGDVDGDGTADFAFRVYSSGALTADDFVSSNGMAPSSGTSAATTMVFLPHSTFAEPLHGLAHLALA